MEMIEIRQYMEPLRKWWWLIALSALLAGVSSALYTNQQPPIYRSSTTIIVGTALENLNPNSGEINLASQLAVAYADMANRSLIRNATREALELERLPTYYAGVIPNTQLIEIAVMDSSPERAQLVAAELANQLLRETPGGKANNDRQTFLDDQLTQLEISILETKDEIERLEGELTRLFSARQIAETKVQISALESKALTLQANYANLLANSRQGATNALTIIEPAPLPTAPVASDLVTNMAVAALVGIALAAAGAYVMEYLDRSVRAGYEAVRYLNLTTLGIIPRVSRGDLQKHGPLIAAGPRSSLLDAYSALRLNVQAAAEDKPLQVLLIASPSPEEGKSTVAANLAIDWARAGERVILVDADLYHPSQQKLFELSNRTGLTTALVDAETDLTDLIKPTKIRGLSVLTTGPILPNPTPLLAQQAMRNLLNTLREMADVIVVDTPPATAVVDASILALQADGVLLVISAEKTDRDMAKATVDQLHQIRARVLGVTLFNTPPQHTFYKEYEHGYGRVSLPETLALQRDPDSSAL